MSMKITGPSQLRQWIETEEDWPLLAEYLLSGSGLPGPRANLGLAGEFAKLFAGSEVTETAWSLLVRWVAISEKQNDTAAVEFLPFCAVQACCMHYGYAAEGRRAQTVGFLKEAMNDARWRIREAAAIGLQFIGEFDFSLLKSLLDLWSAEATPLEQRAFVAALAHPPLLKERSHAQYSLELAGSIMDGLLSGDAESMDAEQFRVLSKGLEYSLSLFVAGDPEAGFALLRRYAQSRDARITRIVKSNLGKTRLSKKYPGQVQEILHTLTMS